MTNPKHYFTYNFINGGWNTEVASTEEQAIEQAQERWADSPELIVDENSFQKQSSDEMFELLNFTL